MEHYGTCYQSTEISWHGTLWHMLPINRNHLTWSTIPVFVYGRVESSRVESSRVESTRHKRTRDMAHVTNQQESLGIGMEQHGMFLQ